MRVVWQYVLLFLWIYSCGHHQTFHYRRSLELTECHLTKLNAHRSKQARQSDPVLEDHQVPGSTPTLTERGPRPDFTLSVTA